MTTVNRSFGVKAADQHRMSILDTIGHIVRHPFNRGHEISALRRYLAWQIGSRTLRTPVVMPFVGGARLVVAAGMTGATGNVYSGLQEFPSMGLVLHLLRAGDLFFDVGANVGSYSILAAETGASCISFEPVAETFSQPSRNIRLNDFGDRCEAVMACVGREEGTAEMTIGLGPVNHVVAKGESGASRTVRQVTLDGFLPRAPSMLKIDVEGVRVEVLADANGLPIPPSWPSPSRWNWARSAMAPTRTKSTRPHRKRVSDRDLRSVQPAAQSLAGHRTG